MGDHTRVEGKEVVALGHQSHMNIRVPYLVEEVLTSNL